MYKMKLKTLLNELSYPCYIKLVWIDDKNQKYVIQDIKYTHHMKNVMVNAIGNSTLISYNYYNIDCEDYYTITFTF